MEKIHPVNLKIFFLFFFFFLILILPTGCLGDGLSFWFLKLNPSPGLPSTVIHSVRIALCSYPWCADCPLLLSTVCGLPSTVIHGVWSAPYSYPRCADWPLLLSIVCAH